MSEIRKQSRQPTMLIAGLGSSHGDDQFGWEVIDRLQGCDVRLKKITHSQALLNHLDTITHLIICDANSETSHEPGEIACYTWPQLPELQRIPASSHASSLTGTLELATETFPDLMKIHIWTVTGKNWEPLSSMSPQVLSAAKDVAELLQRNEIEPHTRGLQNPQFNRVGEFDA
ncbi:hydrogenase maturation protease [Rubinisphaera italica]|uniref:Hydrogenase maturation protease n=1 Tax=Rubinisphaera italica TaxID=2527969 RepID=A0A5C5XA57_9PLAN|nr:hydrogenase maturation protease [Rubinisphaera italica]TWT59674.1 hypothetical protein Pan54_03830 [Rubinisphaera italica]